MIGKSYLKLPQPSASWSQAYQQRVNQTHEVWANGPGNPSTGGTGGGAVTSVAGRTGAVTLAVADVSGAAPLASPTFTGTVTFPDGGTWGASGPATSSEVTLTNNENAGYLCFNATNASTGADAYVQFQLNNASGNAAVVLAGSNWTPGMYNTYPNEALLNNTVGPVTIKTGSLGARALSCDVNGQVTISPGFTVAGLPVGITGARAFVTDSTAAMSGNYGATLTGSGSHTVPVFYDGAAWRIG
jgi:hypothetical protein